MKATNLSNSRGQSMIEFGIMLFFLLTILLAMFEWSQIFIKHMRASTICREAAVAAHHDCRGTEGVDTSTCLQRVRTEMKQKAGRVFPEFNTRGEIILQAFGGSAGFAGGSLSYPSHVGPADIDPAMMSALGTVVVSELYYETKMLTGVERLFAFLMPRLIYKSTII
jgi:hypothetical protein